MGGKLSIQGVRLSYADLPIDNVRLPMLVYGSNFENFSSPTHSKFAAECNWSIKISQNAENSIYFWGKDGFFSKKSDFFSKSEEVENLV